MIPAAARTMAMAVAVVRRNHAARPLLRSRLVFLRQLLQLQLNSHPGRRLSKKKKRNGNQLLLSRTSTTR
jgi:hypothetical protein